MCLRDTELGFFVQFSELMNTHFPGGGGGNIMGYFLAAGRNRQKSLQLCFNENTEAFSVPRDTKNTTN